MCNFTALRSLWSRNFGHISCILSAFLCFLCLFFNFFSLLSSIFHFFQQKKVIFGPRPLCHLGAPYFWSRAPPAEKSHSQPSTMDVVLLDWYFPFDHLRLFFALTGHAGLHNHPQVLQFTTWRHLYSSVSLRPCMCGRNFKEALMNKLLCWNSEKSQNSSDSNVVEWKWSLSHVLFCLLNACNIWWWELEVADGWHNFRLQLGDLESHAFE